MGLFNKHYYKLIRINYRILCNYARNELKDLNLPDKVRMFATAILFSQREPADLKNLMIRTTHSYNKHSGPKEMTKFSEYLHYLEKALPKHILHLINSKLYGEMHNSLETVLSDGYREVDVKAHAKSDLDTAVGTYLEAILAHSDRTKIGQHYQATYSGEFREDTKRIFEHYLGKNFVDNFFKRKDDYSLTVWDTMIDIDQMSTLNPVMTFNEKAVNEIIESSSNRQLYIIDKGNILIGETTKAQLAVFRLQLIRKIKNEIRDADLFNKLSELDFGKPIEIKELIQDLTQYKTLSRLNQEDIIRLCKKENHEEIWDLMQSIALSKTKIEDFIKINNINPENIKSYDVSTKIDDIKEQLESSDRSIPITKSDNDTRILIGEINYAETQQSKNAILYIDHSKQPKNVHPSTAEAFIDHHETELEEKETIMLGNEKVTIIRNPRNLKSPIILEKVGANTSTIVNRFIDPNIKALSVADTILAIAAICDDTDELSLTKVTIEDLKALKKLLLMFAGNDYNDRSNLEIIRLIENTFEGNNKDVIKKLKNLLVIKNVIKDTNEITQKYQIELRETKNPQIVGFDSKNEKSDAISKLINDEETMAKKGMLHISQEKLTISTLNRIGNIDPINDINYLSSYFESVKGTDDQTDAIIHMASMKPEDIAKNYDAKKHKDIKDYLFVYSPNRKNMEGILSRLIEEPLLKNDGTYYSKEEIKVKLIFSNPMEEGRDFVYTSDTNEINHIKSKENWENFYTEDTIQRDGQDIRILKLKTENLNFSKLYEFINSFAREDKAGLTNHVWDCFTGKVIIELPPGTCSSRKKQIKVKF